MLRFPKLPVINGGSSTKGAIISIVSCCYPLTKAKIHREIRKLGFSASFHAVNKAVNELHSNVILDRQGREYLPNYNWLKSLHDFSAYAISRLKDKKGFLIRGVKEIKRDGDITTLTFGNLFDMDTYSNQLHNLYYSKLGEHDKTCMVYRHHWWHFLYPFNEYPSKIKNRNFYCICTQNTALDRSGMKFKKLIGMNVKYKRSFPLAGYTVYGSIIVQRIISRNIEKALDNFFTKTKKVEDLADMKKFTEKILKKEGKVILIINKNCELAAEIRKNILSEFRKKTKEKYKANNPINKCLSL